MLTKNTIVAWQMKRFPRKKVSCVYPIVKHEPEENFVSEDGGGFPKLLEDDVRSRPSFQNFVCFS